MRFRSGIAITCLAISGHALAADAQNAAQTTASGDENVLGEIIVTARFRQENVQDVPITVTALSSEALEERGITDMIALSSVVPNLQIRNTNAGPNQSDIRLRGVPDVAVYVDGIAHSNTAGQLMDVVDVDRVEVLNGPQGTLFGKNAIGGAIQYVTTKPSDTFSASSKFTFGSYEHVDATGTLNIPWTDVFYTKITGASLQHGGYVRDIGTNDYDGADRYTVARFDALLKPTDAFNARFIFAYTGETANQPANVSTQNDLVCKGDPIPPEYTGKIPGPLCVLNTIGLKVNPNLDFGAQKLWEADSPTHDGDEGYDYKSYDFTLDLNLALSDHWGIRSLTGYRDEWFSKLANHNGTPYVLISNATGGISTEFTQELQLAFNSDWLKGTTGLYYYKDKFLRASISWTYTDLETGTLAAQSAALGGRTPSFNQNEYDNIIEGYAAYSEWTAKLADKLSFTVGARYNTEDNDTILYPAPVESLVCCTRLPDNLQPGGGELVPPRLSAVSMAAEHHDLRDLLEGVQRRRFQHRDQCAHPIQTRDSRQLRDRPEVRSVRQTPEVQSVGLLRRVQGHPGQGGSALRRDRGAGDGKRRCGPGQGPGTRKPVGRHRSADREPQHRRAQDCLYRHRRADGSAEGHRVPVVAQDDLRSGGAIPLEPQPRQPDAARRLCL